MVRSRLTEAPSSSTTRRNNPEPEGARFLSEVGDPHAGAAKHRHRRDVPFPEDDPTLVRLDESDHHVERRSLTGAVRAEQADNLSGRDIEGDAVYHPSPTIGLAQTVRGEVEGFGAQGVSSG